MNPYRTPPPTEKYKYRPRKFWKTLGRKLLIKFKGTWKDRNWRCQRCGKCVLSKRSGEYYDPGPFFHYLECGVTYHEKNNLSRH